MHIAQKFAAGLNEFQIRLDPPELGRIDIRMEIARDGHMTAQLSADRPETLDALQRDQRALERALQAAGLDLDEGALSFNLRGGDAGEARDFSDRGQASTGSGEDTSQEAARAVRHIVSLNELDIRV